MSYFKALDCTKFDFGWGCSTRSLAGFKEWVLLLRKGKGDREREREEKDVRREGSPACT